MANNNLNYNFLNPIKFFTNKLWNENIIDNYEKGLNNLNRSFNEKLDLIVNVENNDIISGSFLDDDFNENNYGLISLKKIDVINFNSSENIDKYYITDINQKKTLVNIIIDVKEINKIDSNNLYNYVVKIKDESLFTVINDQFNSTINYTIELYDINYKNDIITISDPNFSTDSLQFYYSKIIKSPKDLSIITKEQFYVTDIIDYGKTYSINLEYPITLSDNYKILYQENTFEVIKLNDNNLICSNITINNLVKYFKIEFQLLIQSYNYISENVTIIKFLNNNFNDFYFSSSNTNYIVYIVINQIIYELNYDYINKYFFIQDNVFDKTMTDNINSFTNVSIISKIFKFIKFLDMTLLDYRYGVIEINRNLKNYIHNIQYDEEMPSNIISNNEDINIEHIKIQTDNKILIKYTLDNSAQLSDIVSNSVFHNYRLKESIDYRLYNIKNSNIFLYKIKNNFSFKENENINLNIELLYNFYDDNLSNTLLNCEIYEINSQNILFTVSLSESLINYNDNEILKEDIIINDSIIDFYKRIDISNNILINNTVINNSDILYLLFDINDDFIYSHFYDLPEELVLSNNDIIELQDKLRSSNFLDLKFVTELIGEYLWNSNEIFEFKTKQIKIQRDREISVNYKIDTLNLSQNSNYYWGDNSIYPNIKDLISSDDIKVFKLNNKLYGMIRSINTDTSQTFTNPLMPYNANNISNMNLNIEINQTFPVNIKYNFDTTEFNDSVTNITLQKLSFTKTHENLVSILELVNNINYSYQLLFISNNDDSIGVDITNIKYFSNRIEVEISDNIIINSTYYSSYSLIEKINDSTISKNDFFELYEVELKQDIPIFLNRGDFFETQLFWVDENLNNLPYLNNYFILIEDTNNWNYSKYMNLVHNGIISSIYIISMIVFQNSMGNYLHYILFSSDKNILPTDTIEINSINWDLSISISNILDFYKYKIDLYNQVLFYKYDNEYSKIYLFSKYNKLNYFNFISNINLNTINKYSHTIEKSSNKLIVRFKYEKIELINNSYKNIGLNKVEDQIIFTSSSENEIYDPLWIKELQINFFKSIDLIFNDNIIEKIDANMLQILYNFNFSIFKETSFDKIVRIKYDDDGLYFYFPLKLFFTTIYKFLPLCLMKKSNISINFNVNSLENLLSNSGTISNNVRPILDVYYTTYHLEKNIISELKNSTKFMLAQVCYNYSNSIINNNVSIIHTKLYNMIKDIFIVVDNIKYNNQLFDRDFWYKNYIEKLDNFKNSSDILIEDKELFELIENEILNGSERINVIKNNYYLKDFDLNYILYLDNKYLRYLNEDLNSLKSNYSQKLTILILYFKKVHYEEKIINNGSLEKIQLKMDGLNISPKISGSYYNDVIPYFKGYTLNDNHYVYSFGLNSRSKQPNGHVNFKMIEDFSIEVTKKSNISRAKLKVYSKEYKIIRFQDDDIQIIN